MQRVNPKQCIKYYLKVKSFLRTCYVGNALDSWGANIDSIWSSSKIIRFARVSSHVVDFNARNKSLTAKLLQQGYRYHKLRKTFSKFYRRHYELVSKFSVGLKTLLHQGLSELEFYGDLVHKFKKIVGRADFSDQFRKITVRYKRIGYNINNNATVCMLSVYPNHG